MDSHGRVTDDLLCETFRAVPTAHGLTSQEIHGYLRAEHGRDVTDKDVRMAIHRGLKNNKLVPKPRGRFLWWSKDADCDKAKPPPAKKRSKTSCKIDKEEEESKNKKKEESEEDSECEEKKVKKPKKKKSCPEKKKKRKPSKPKPKCGRKTKPKPKPKPKKRVVKKGNTSCGSRNPRR